MNERQDAECVERYGERVSLCHSLSAEQQFHIVCGGTIEKQGSGSSVGVEHEATSTWPKVPGIPQGCLPVKRVECVRCIDRQNTPTFAIAFVFVEEVVRSSRGSPLQCQLPNRSIVDLHCTSLGPDVIPGNHHHRLCHHPAKTLSDAYRSDARTFVQCYQATRKKSLNLKSLPCINPFAVYTRPTTHTARFFSYTHVGKLD